MDTRSDAAIIVYTIAEAADIIKVSRQVLRKWIALGYISSIRLPSGHLRIRQSEVVRVLSETRTH